MKDELGLSHDFGQEYWDISAFIYWSCWYFQLNLQSPEVSYSELVFSGGSLGGPSGSTVGGPSAPKNCPQQQQQQHRGGTEYALIMPQTSKTQHQQNASNLAHHQPNKQATILPRPRRPEEVAFILFYKMVLLKKSKDQIAGRSIIFISLGTLAEKRY